MREFQRQVALQCKFLLIAANEVNTGLQQKNTERVFYALQNLLNAGANISKMLWGQKDRKANERKPIRDSADIADNSPLREVAMRNNFEHLDERIDRWWNESKVRNYADMNLGPKSMFNGLDTMDMFRLYDPTTANLMFWGQEFNIQAIVLEVEKILPRLQEEADKPLWEEVSPELREAPAGTSPDVATEE